MPRLRDLPVAAVMAVGMGLLAVTAVVLVFLATFDIARRNTVELTRDKAGLVIASIVERTHSHLDPVTVQVEHLAGLIAGEPITVSRREALGTLLHASLAATPQVSVMAFANPELQVLRAFRNRPGAPVELKDWSDVEAFRGTVSRAEQADGPYWGEPFFAERSGLTFLNLYMPVRRDGRFLGTLIAGVSVRELSEFLSALGRDLTDSPFINAFILYDDRFVLAHPLLQWGFPGLSDAQPLPAVGSFGDPVLQVLWSPEQRVEVDPRYLGRFEAHGFRLGDERYVAVYRRLDEYGDRPWIAGTYLRLADIAPQVERLGFIPWIAAAVIVGAFVIAFLLGRGLSRPIRQLAAAATGIRDLDFSGPPVGYNGLFRELNQAASAFNAMVRGLRSFETYVPRTLVRRLIQRHGEGAVLSEEREVTILFTDISGFTPLAETLPAKDLARFLNEHFSLLESCVEAEGGTVDKYIGDSLMAFWGAPDEQEDTASRACRCALAIANEIERDNAERQAAAAPPVEVRIGVHTGPVVVGNIGSPGRVNYTIVGDAVNVCQRIETLGKEVEADGAARILISGATAARLGPDFRLKRIGPVALKGKEGAIDVYQLA